mgnify:CR=1 FL=1
MIKSITSIILATSLVACFSDNDNSNSEPVSLSTMAGVWDASVTDPIRGKDESYMVIDNQGSFILYDYMGEIRYRERTAYLKLWRCVTATLKTPLMNNRALRQ